MKTIKNVADVKSLDIIAAFKQAKKVYYDTVEEVCESITAYNTPKQSNKIDEALKKYDKKFYINNRQFLEISIIDASFEKYGVGALFIGFNDDTGENFNHYPSASFEVCYSLSEVAYYWNDFLKRLNENTFIYR